MEKSGLNEGLIIGRGGWESVRGRRGVVRDIVRVYS